MLEVQYSFHSAVNSFVNEKYLVLHGDNFKVLFVDNTVIIFLKLSHNL